MNQLASFDLQCDNTPEARLDQCGQPGAVGHPPVKERIVVRPVIVNVVHMDVDHASQKGFFGYTQATCQHVVAHVPAETQTAVAYLLDDMQYLSASSADLVPVRIGNQVLQCWHQRSVVIQHPLQECDGVSIESVMRSCLRPGSVDDDRCRREAGSDVEHRRISSLDLLTPLPGETGDGVWSQVRSVEAQLEPQPLTILHQRQKARPIGGIFPQFELQRP